MMADGLLVERYHRYLDRLVALSEKEIARTAREDARFNDVARFYLGEFSDIRRIFRDVYGSDLVRAFRKHRDTGKLEIITCGATHGFLPLMDSVPEAVRAQVQIAVAHYKKVLERDPAGIWLPECGYLPGQDRFLREAGLRYGFLESHGLRDAHPRPSAGVLAPILSPEGIAFFGRDMESSRQVWSAESGYPGDYDYRESKDVGWSCRSTTWARSSPTACAERLRRYRDGKVGLGDSPTSGWALQRGLPMPGTSSKPAAPGPGPPRGWPGACGQLRRRVVRPLVVRGAGLPPSSSARCTSTRTW
jgi:predicted glycosyl hydrolase (DUF1957 family)